MVREADGEVRGREESRGAEGVQGKGAAQIPESMAAAGGRPGVSSEPRGVSGQTDRGGNEGVVGRGEVKCGRQLGGNRIRGPMGASGSLSVRERSPFWIIQAR